MRQNICLIQFAIIKFHCYKFVPREYFLYDKIIQVVKNKQKKCHTFYFLIFTVFLINFKLLTMNGFDDGKHSIHLFELDRVKSTHYCIRHY